LPSFQVGAVARGTPVDALALAAAVSQPWVDVVLSGVKVQATQMVEILRDAESGRPAWPARAPREGMSYTSV
jgi:hypothetical protein